MHKFKIEVKFRIASKFTKYNIKGGSEITGMMELETDRCDIDAILSDYNVASYKIVACSYPVQVMREFQDVPEFYYE